VALLASGCATMTPPVQTGDWAERRAELQALEDWNLDGRIAVAAGADGFSGGLNWEQRGERAEITLRGPMGGAAILIRLEGIQYVVTDERGKVYGGEDARRFIAEHFGPGSPLPIAEMRYWLVGAPAPDSPYTEAIGEGGSLSGLEQLGWTVGYERYRTVGSLALPERIEMTTESLRLRFAISDWRLGP
jgi:outer membrane lipoprotein LolB